MPSNSITIDSITEIKEITVLQSNELLEGLAEYINQLILTNFERLVQLLYRIDVSEMKLKQLLKDNPQSDAGLLIAKMIIDRQIQKIQLKKEMESKPEDWSEEERW